MEVEVEDGLNVHGHVNLNVLRQSQRRSQPLPKPPGLAPVPTRCDSTGRAVGAALATNPGVYVYFEIFEFQYVDRFEVYPGVSRRQGKVGTEVGTSSREGRGRDGVAARRAVRFRVGLVLTMLTKPRRLVATGK